MYPTHCFILGHIGSLQRLVLFQGTQVFHYRIPFHFLSRYISWSFNVNMSSITQFLFHLVSMYVGLVYFKARRTFTIQFLFHFI